MAYAIGGGTANTYPGLMPGSYSDIFSTQTIDLANFGQNWVQNTNSPISGNGYYTVSISSTGQYQTIVIENDYIYTSSDYGTTWTKRNTTPDEPKLWYGVSVSASGKYQTANASGDYIYVSSDYGEKWYQKTSETQNWNGVSISASGQYQTSVVVNDYIYISSDYGTTWSPVTSIETTLGWCGISISASGQYQIATYGPGFIYISSNYGNTWSQTNTSIGTKNWYGVSVSASGQYQTACVVSGNTYVSSDYGNNWTQTTVPYSYVCAVSSSGQYQVVCNDLNLSWCSTDYGKTWTTISTLTSSNTDWVAISSSGQYIVTGNKGYYMNTCQNSIANGVVSVGNYSSTSGVTGSIGSIYYDTTDSVLKYSDGTSWTSLATGSGIAGVTAVGYIGLTGGVTLTSDNYLQMAYAIGGNTSTTYPGLMPGSYSDIFSTQTIDLANFGQNWIQNTSAVSKSYTCVAVSASGKYQIVGAYGGSLYISSNYGSSWSSVGGAEVGGSKNWISVSISASGQYVTAAVNGGYIYRSNNYASNSSWTQVSSSTSYLGVSISASGRYQTAVVENGSIYISSNYGSSWTSQTSGAILYSVSISASGQYQTASSDSSVYISSNYGSTWKSVSQSQTGVRYALSVSVSGQYQTTNSQVGNVCISSDYGNTWSSVTSLGSQSWRSVSMSASGQYQVGGGGSGPIYVSSNYGSSWTTVTTGSSGSLYGVAMSASGQYITLSIVLILSTTGLIYTCQNSIANGVVSVGNYSSTPSGTTGSIYYDTTSSVLKVSNGSSWSSLSELAGVTAVGSFGLTGGATLTSDNYLQMAYAIGGGTANTYPGLMPGSYSDIFSTQTIDLANFGQNWVQKIGSSTIGWHKVAVSATGQYQTAVVFGGSVWISSDYGNNWMDIEDTNGYNWNSVSVSASGQYQTACVYEGLIWISSDYGNTWTDETSTSSYLWYSVSISASGQYQTACAYNGSIWISSNYGSSSSWSEVTSTSNYSWNSVSISASGQYQTAVVFGGSVWISSDYGNNWTEIKSTTGYNWFSVSISASGQYQTASVSENGSSIYTSSDYGNNWTVTTSPDLGWKLVEVSSSGQYQIASLFSGGGLYISTNYGSTWSEVTNTAGKNWTGVSISASGQYITAIYYKSGVYSIYTCKNGIANSVSGVTAVGVTASYGATLTSDNYLQLVAAGATYPGILTTGSQTIAGSKTFSSDITVNSLTVGRGGGNVSTNTAVGNAVLASNTTGSYNTALGMQSLNTNVGGTYNVGIGYYANVGSANLYNVVAIGASAVGYTSNTIQMGNSNIKQMNTYGTVGVGNYVNDSAATGITGSIYYNTSDSELKVYNGTSWSSIGSGSSLVGVTTVGSFGLTGGATLTSDNYLQMAYAIGGGTANTYPGLMPGSYSDIFSTQTIDLANFGKNWVQNTTTNLSSSQNRWVSISISASGQYQTACSNYSDSSASGNLKISSDYGQTWTTPTLPSVSGNLYYQQVVVSASGQYQMVHFSVSPSSLYIYNSSDFGSTWDPVTFSSYSNNYNVRIAISASGQYQFILYGNTTLGELINISNDYGTNWTTYTVSSSFKFSSVYLAVSASGQYVTFCTSINANNYVYTSSNYGKSFVQNTTITSANGFAGMAMSASGQYQTITSSLPLVYISSDYGQTWNLPTTGSGYSSDSISISASGQYQVMGSFLQMIYSKDYGNNWSTISVANIGVCTGVSISASGQYISAVNDNKSNLISCIFTCQNSISNGVVSVGNYSSTPAGTTGSIYYDTSSSALKVYSGSAWSSIGSGSSLVGVTTVGVTASNGATLTTDSYLQLVAAGATYPGIVTTTGQTFAGNKTFTNSVTLGDASTDTLTVNATSTFYNNVTLGDASTDILTVNGTSTFNNNVTLGSDANDTLTVNAKSVFGATANFNSFLIGTTGTFSNTVTAAAFNSTSDYRVKENIQDLNLNIYNVNPLRPVNYFNNRLNKLDIGFIAHEVQEYYPFLVSGEKDGEENQSLNYSGLIGILVKEIQELKQRVKQLEDNTK